MICLIELTDRVLDSSLFGPEGLPTGRGGSDISLRRRTLRELKSLVDSFPQDVKQHVIAEMRFVFSELSKHRPALAFRGH
jgi:hypothetical protein